MTENKGQKKKTKFLRFLSYCAASVRRHWTPPLYQAV